MYVILNSPITIIVTTAKLVLENVEDGVGTIEFQIMEQPCRLVVTTAGYYYDTVFSVGDRVKLKEAFGALGIDSEGTLKEIIIDMTEDKADVLFDTIYPNQEIYDEHNVVSSGNISLLFRVPLSYLEKI